MSGRFLAVEKRETVKQGGCEQSSHCQSTGASNLEEGHQAADYRASHLPQKATSEPAKMPGKPSQKTREMALEGVEVDEITPSSDNGARIPTASLRSNTDDNPLVSRPITPVTIPIELVVTFLGRKGNLVALLDSGHTRCLVSPSLVEKSGLQLRELKVQMASCQLDGSIAGGGGRHNIFHQTNRGKNWGP